jgi:hypothetical protein
MSVRDQWAGVAIFGASGLLLLMGYAWCTARARHDRGPRRILDEGPPEVPVGGGSVEESRVDGAHHKPRVVGMRQAAAAA